jgi:hypothetical protein
MLCHVVRRFSHFFFASVVQDLINKIPKLDALQICTTIRIRVSSNHTILTTSIPHRNPLFLTSSLQAYLFHTDPSTPTPPLVPFALLFTGFLFFSSRLHVTSALTNMKF